MPPLLTTFLFFTVCMVLVWCDTCLFFSVRYRMWEAVLWPYRTRSVPPKDIRLRLLLYYCTRTGYSVCVIHTEGLRLCLLTVLNSSSAQHSKHRVKNMVPPVQEIPLVVYYLCESPGWCNALLISWRFVRVGALINKGMKPTKCSAWSITLRTSGSYW